MITPESLPPRNRVSVLCPLVADHRIRVPVTPPSRVYLLLHGYLQDADSLWSRLEPLLPVQAAVLSPNGPFPVPRKTPNDGWTLGYSWYFYDAATDEYAVDMETSIHFLRALLKELKLSHCPITVIGFSQGGYLAPIFAQAEPRVDRVIGMGCQFLIDELRPPAESMLKKVRWDALHGALDEVVSPARARELHDRAVAAGNPGKFVLVETEGHRIGTAMRKALKELLGHDG